MSRIEVTAADIRLGQPEMCHKDALALACRRALHCAVVVLSPYVQIRRGSTWTCYELPAEAQEFSAKFDAGQLVAPFSFDLGRVVPVTELPKMEVKW